MNYLHTVKIDLADKRQAKMFSRVLRAFNNERFGRARALTDLEEALDFYIADERSADIKREFHAAFENPGARFGRASHAFDKWRQKILDARLTEQLAAESPCALLGTQTVSCNNTVA